MEKGSVTIPLEEWEKLKSIEKRFEEKTKRELNPFEIVFGFILGFIFGLSFRN